MNRCDDSIRRLQEILLGQVSVQGAASTPARGIGAKKRDSTAQLFAQLAEQFVDQVKSSFAKINEPSEEKEEDDDDDDIILIDPNTSEPINKNGNESLKVAERRVRIRGIPNRAASRVAEVLKNELGITIFEAKRLDAVEEKENSLLNEAHQPKSTASKASLLPMAASNVAEEDSSDDIEIIEIDETPSGDTIAPSSLRENGSEDLSDRIADENPANASRVLATTSKNSAPVNVACQSTSPTATTENQLPSTCSTAVQFSPDRIVASQPIPVITKSTYQAQLVTVYQITPVTPQSSSLRVVRELVKPTLPESTRSSSPLAPPTSSSIDDQQSEEPETTQSRSAFGHSNGDITDSDSELNDSVSASVGDRANSVANLLAQHSKPVGKHSGRPRKSWAPTSQKDAFKELSVEVVDSIHRNSQSITVFAVNLIRHLFDKTEVLACKDLFWRARCFTTANASDVKRIHLIQRLVQEKAGSEYSTELWNNCILFMRKAILKTKQIHQRDIRLARIRNDDEANNWLFPKKSKDLKETEFYAQNGLSFQEINSLYHQSNSYLGFARKLIQLLFDQWELLECQNVYGRRCNTPADNDRALDPKRIQFIRHIVEENSDFSDELWRECVHTMNHKISRLKRSIKT